MMTSLCARLTRRNRVGEVLVVERLRRWSEHEKLEDSVTQVRSATRYVRADLRLAA